MYAPKFGIDLIQQWQPTVDLILPLISFVMKMLSAYIFYVLLHIFKCTWYYFYQGGMYVLIQKFSSGRALSHRKSASMNKPVAFRSVHTGIEPPFLLKIYYAITACVTRSFTSRKYWLKEKW